VIRNATLVADVVGTRALVAEAINDVAASFYVHAGLRRSAIRADLLYLPLR